MGFVYSVLPFKKHVINKVSRTVRKGSSRKIEIFKSS